MRCELRRSLLAVGLVGMVTLPGPAWAGEPPAVETQPASPEPDAEAEGGGETGAELSSEGADEGEGAETDEAAGSESAPVEPAPVAVEQTQSPTGASGTTLVRPRPPAPIEPDPRNYRLVLAGDIVIGLGGAALVATVVGLGIRAEAIDRRDALLVGDADLDAIAKQDQRISTGTTLAIAGGAATAAVFAAGITMVALGYKRERERRRQLPALYLGPRGAGLSWALRF